MSIFNPQTSLPYLNVSNYLQGNTAIIGTTTAFNNTQVSINSSNAGNIGAAIRAAISQTADLQQWQDSNGNALAQIKSNGNFSTTGGLYAGGNVGLGVASPQSKIHVDSGNATASSIKFTAGSTTGQLPTSGFDIGIASDGAAELRNRINSDLNVYINNNAYLKLAKSDVAIFFRNQSVGGFYNNPSNIFNGIDYYNYPTASTPSANRLANAPSRYTVSVSNVNNSSALFDNNFEVAATTTQGLTGVVTINAGYTYSAGMLALTFYTGSLPTTILVESQNSSQIAGNTWNTLFSTTTNTSNNVKVNTSGAGNYPSALRISYSSANNDVRCTEIEWLPNRTDPGEYGYLPQYQSGTLNTKIDTLALNSSTASTSTVTGALTVSGGVGISGSVYCGPINSGTIACTNGITSNNSTGDNSHKFYRSGVDWLQIVGTRGTGINAENNSFCIDAATQGGSLKPIKIRAIDYVNSTVVSVATFTPQGRMLLATTIDNGVDTLQVNGTAKAAQFKLTGNNVTPASSSDTGTAGEIRFDSSYIYYCVAANSWKRTPLSSW